MWGKADALYNRTNDIVKYIFKRTQERLEQTMKWLKIHQYLKRVNDCKKIH